MFILGLSAYYHDSAALLLRDGEIVAAAQEERFTRSKHDPSFPANAIRFCLEYAGISLDRVDAVVFYEKPFLKFERLLETYYAFAPRGITSFLAAMPAWMREKLMMKRLIGDELAKIGDFDRKGSKLLFSGHHLSHAGSAFFPSPFDEAAILTIDGSGEWATASISHGRGSSIAMLRELRFPHSLGLLYSAFTYYLGFKVNSGEYKLMGLAPYGDPESGRVDRYIELIKRELLELFADGSIWLNQEYFAYATGLRMTCNQRWEALFGFPARQPEEELRPEHCDLALAIQRITDEVVEKMAREAQRLTGAKRLCLAGGVALNCVANGRLLKSGLFDDIWVQPAAGDAGGALGAAYSAYHMRFSGKRTVDPANDRMSGSYLGPEYSSLDIERMARGYDAVASRYDSFAELCEATARLLAQGRVVGWFQGRMEWGPRALGNRSIIADPRNPEMQKRLNQKIKNREGFRPFAPSVLAEEAADYFELDVPSPYMMLVADVAKKRRRPLPEGYTALPVRDKLYHVRSDIPAVTHIDYSARIQTVHRGTNPRYWQLIRKFQELTGYGLLVNTSFNVRGEPIVMTPHDAYACFMKTEMDYLVLGDYLFAKDAQPQWKERPGGGREHEPD